MEQAVTTGRIVVAIDGSVSSKRALHWAAQEATIRSVGLDVVHAWTAQYPVYRDGGYIDPGPFEQQAHAILDDAIESLAGRVPPLEVHPRLIEDDAATAVLRAAEGAGLLVVGSRGHGGFVGLLLGSVSQRCVDHAPCPVAVVPPGSAADRSGRVVVGVDGSGASQGALRWAIAEARRRDAGLEVVNAYDPGEVSSPFVPMVALNLGELEASSKVLLTEMVEEALGADEVRPRDVELVPVSAGAARALLERAEGADLLVVGSRGRGSFRGLLMGSVSQQCVHHAPCPLVVVRPPDPSAPPDGGDRAAP